MAKFLRETINLVFILIGTAAVLMLFAGVLNTPARPDAALRIEAGLEPGLEARSLYGVLQTRVDEINTAVSNDPSPVSFTIEAGDHALTVAQKLQAAGLISDAELFTQLLQYNGLDTRLQAGVYQLRRNMTMRQIGGALYRGRFAPGVVTVPPGWRLEELADYLSTTGIMDGEWFLQEAQQGTVVDHPLLVDRPPGQSYEGYLFPGDYPMSDQATPAELIGQMLNNMAQHLPPHAAGLAGQQGLTLHQALTLASLVEREAALAKERPLIASVFLNRLTPGSGAPYLQADPTLQYALGRDTGSGQWWSVPSNLAEYAAIESPYNTYLYPGLPPGPIASPGLDSIMAVLQPAQTDYLFFVCRRPGCAGGEHIFTATYEEHLQNVRLYWGE
ncbi:MAG: endolytic transglycosylase MltG [Chloroflexota bacterium]